MLVIGTVFIIAAILIRDPEFNIIVLLFSITMIFLFLYGFRKSFIKDIILTDSITIQRYLFPDKVLSYEEILDIGDLFIKFKKFSIFLAYIDNSDELKELMIQRLKILDIKPKENFQNKQIKSSNYAAIAMFIATIADIAILFFIIAVLHIDIPDKPWNFLLIWLPVFLLSYFIVQVYYKKKETPASKLIEEAQLYIRHERYEAAIEICNRLIEMNPTNSDAYFTKGVAFNYLKLNEEAIEEYKKSIELKSKNPAAYLNIGSSLASIEKYIEAIDYYDIAIKLYSKEANFYINKAIALMRLDKFDEALKNINKAVKLKKDSGNAYYIKSSIMLKIGRRDEAVKLLKKSIKLAPQLKELAKADKSFTDIRTDIDFKNLIE